jgi:hypothetical protein
MPSPTIARRAPAALPAGLILLVAAACGGTTMVAGECQPVHGADVCVWGETAGKEVVAFGATVPMAAIEGAPADAEMAWPPVALARISLPEAVGAGTGIRTLTVYWEPHGHPPGAYLTPHWDFHFYNRTIAEIDAIDCADVTKPAAIPAGYALPDIEIPGLGNLVGLCVPKMGMHALLASELESDKIFEKTLVVGYDRQRPIFVEPMIAHAHLLKRASFTFDMPTVADAPAGVRYPTQFRADYDSTAQAYRFVFSGMAGPKAN